MTVSNPIGARSDASRVVAGLEGHDVVDQQVLGRLKIPVRAAHTPHPRIGRISPTGRRLHDEKSISHGLVKHDRNSAQSRVSTPVA